MEESLAAMDSISGPTEANIDKSNVPEEWETLPNIEIKRTLSQVKTKSIKERLLEQRNNVGFGENRLKRFSV